MREVDKKTPKFRSGGIRTYVLSSIFLLLSFHAFAIRYTNDLNWTWTVPQSGFVSAGSSKVAMSQLHLQLMSSSGTYTYTLISLSYNTTGTTNTSDILSAKLWYNTANNLNTATQVGGTISNPSGTITFTLNQVLSAVGPFYYWITYDISSAATAGNFLGASLQSIVNTDYLHTTPFTWIPNSNETTILQIACSASVVAPPTPSLPAMSIFTEPTMACNVMSTGVGIVCEPSGSVYVAGSDQDGELGDGVVGSPYNSNNQWLQVNNPNINSIVQVDDGVNTNVVLRSDGTVWGWGDNWVGKIGDGTYGLGGGTSPQPTPKQTKKSAAAGGGFLTNVVKVMTGYNCTVALTADHKVYAWGLNSAGQFGPSFSPYSYHPSAELLTYDGINPINWAIDVDCGDDFIVILRWNGTVWTMGDGSFGQFGNGQGGVGYGSSTPVSAYAPGGCTALSGIKSISAGRRFVLAADSFGNAYGWGLNNYWQTGTGGSGSDEYSPKKILGPACSGFLNNVMQVTTAGDAGYALTSTGDLYSWGSDQNEELGDGAGGINRQCPQLVYSNVVEVRGGSYSVFARNADGSICAVGSNWFGNFGLGGPFGCCSYVNTFTCTIIEDVLPIELLLFTGHESNNAIELEWSTASEFNNAYFMIERSFDALTFQEIGKVNGAGSSPVENNYRYTDYFPQSGVNYYRLKQVDLDGSFENSGIIAVTFSGMQSGIFIFPDPVTDVLSVYLNSLKTNGKYELRVIDIAGEVLIKEKLAAMSESVKFGISVESLSSGIYFLEISDSGNQQNIIRFVKR